MIVMQLDLATLTTVNCFAFVSSGFLLIYAWWTNRDARSALICGLADLLLAAGLILSSIQAFPAFIASTVCFITTASMVWAASRASRGAPIIVPINAAGAVV